MPARSHPVRTSLWGRRFRAVSSAAKLVHLYVLTCPHRRSEGLFELSPGHVAVDTGLGFAEVEELLTELHEAGWLLWDPDAELVLDPDALKVSPLRNGHGKDGTPRPDKRIDPAVRHFELLPDSPLKAAFVAVADEASPDLAAAIRQRVGDAIPPSREGPLAPPSEGPSEGGSGGEKKAPSRVESRTSRTEQSRNGVVQAGRVCRVATCGAPARWRDPDGDVPFCDDHRGASFEEAVPLEATA